MNKKLGHIMSSSRLVSFVAFLAATFAWILKMPALFFVSAVFLVVSGVIYGIDLWKKRLKDSEA